MFLLVKNIDGENIIIGTATKRVSVADYEESGTKIYEINDSEFNSDMINAKIDSFEEDN